MAASVPTADAARAPMPSARAGAEGRPPRISVVMPSYRQGRWIDAALASLFRQNDPNLEVIVVDGGSDDGTLAVLDRWRVRLAHCLSEPDRGQADALRKGLALASGEILAWLNSDDMHLPWTLAAVRAAFTAEPGLELVHGDRVIVDADGIVTGFRHLPGHSAYLLNRWPWTHQETVFWRRPLFERAGGIDPDLTFAMDYDLFGRLFRMGRCRHLPRPLGVFRWHPLSKSFTQQRNVGAAEIAEVRRRLGTTPRWWERPIGSAYSLLVRGVTRWSGEGRRRDLPPMPPGSPVAAVWPVAGGEPA
jgi:glycosyltransferase involved in cell wall biosynthesis